MGLLRRLLAALVAATIALTAPAALASPQDRMRAWVNDSRHDAGLRLVKNGWRLARLAGQHSFAMAREGSIFHSTLPCSYWGQNVGAIARQPHWIRRLHQAFMESPSHRANVLNPYFTRVGIGIVRDGRLMFVTLNFSRGSC